MSDEELTHEQGPDSSGQPENAPPRRATVDPARRATRRPRPSPAYTAGRRASYARNRAPAKRRPIAWKIVLPLVALVVVLLVLAGFVADRAHIAGFAAPPTATPTITPVPTVAPTSTPIPVTPPPTSKAGVAAVVNGQPVPMDLFAVVIKVDANTLQLGSTNPTTGQTTPPVDITTAAGLKALHQHERDDLTQLIQTEAAVAYANAHHLVATSKQVQDALNSLYAQDGGKAAFLKQAEGQGYTEAVITKLIGDGTTEQNVYNVIGKLAPKDGVNARHIVLATKNSALATTLAKQLQADHGSNFAALAKKYSTDTTTSSSGGALGVVTKGQLDPAVQKVLFTLKTNQISTPIKTSSGWEIVQSLGPGASQTSMSNYFTAWLKQQAAKATIYVKIPNP